jgi:uncharacterized membrane protein
MDDEKKPSKFLRIVLVASLALNVAVIGAVSGLALSSNSKGTMPQRMSFEFGLIGRVLEREDRRAISENMRRDGPRPLSRNAMRAQVGEIAQALRADPFDPVMLSGLIGDMRDRSAGVQRNAQAAFIAHLTAMTPAKRAALADKLDSKRR